MSTTQDTQTPQQPQWWEDRRREGYMIVREWRDEEGARHQELMSADMANAQQQRIQALEAALREAVWFVEWVEAANLKPAEAAMDGQAKRWLPKIRALLSPSEAK